MTTNFSKKSPISDFMKTSLVVQTVSCRQADMVKPRGTSLKVSVANMSRTSSQEVKT
jgi:hypothetical protein